MEETENLNILENDLGIDELNLAEFPLAVLSQRPKGNKVEYKNMVTDRHTGEKVERSLTITVDQQDVLPTPFDSNIILGLLQFHHRVDEDGYQDFSLRELADVLGLQSSGNVLSRIKSSVDKWYSVHLFYKNAWFDARNKTWKNAKFRIIDAVIFDENGYQIRWGTEFISSLQSNYFKPLDLKIYRNLKNPLAQILFRFIDKKLWKSPTLDYNLENLACNHLGLPKKLSVSEIKRRMKPALESLEILNIITRNSERFYKKRKEWRVRFTKVSKGCESLVSVEKDKSQDLFESSVQLPILDQRLLDLGLSENQLKKIKSEYDSPRIEKNLEHVLFLRSEGKKIAKLAAYFLAVLEDDPELPVKFITEAERVEKEVIRTQGKQDHAEKIASESAKAQAELETTKREVDQFLDSLSEKESESFIKSCKLNGLASQTGGVWWYMALEEKINEIR